MPSRHFPPPWTVDETDACFIVKDSNGQALAYVYYEPEPGRRTAANLLTRDEARHIAGNVAKLAGAAEAVAGLGRPVVLTRCTPRNRAELVACLIGFGDGQIVEAKPAAAELLRPWEVRTVKDALDLPAWPTAACAS